MGVVCKQEGGWVVTRVADLANVRDELRFRSRAHGVDVYDLGARAGADPFVAGVLPPGWDDSIIMGDAIFLGNAKAPLRPSELKRAFSVATETGPVGGKREASAEEEDDDEVPGVAQDTSVVDEEGEGDGLQDEEDEDVDDDAEPDDDEVAIVNAGEEETGIAEDENE